MALPHQPGSPEYPEPLNPPCTPLPLQSGTPEYKALVDLGTGVHCRAIVPDATRICIAAGLGFYVECTLPEALRVVELRRALLQAKVDSCVSEAARVRARLRFVLQAIGELQALHLQRQ
jgi:prefoldin subunit 5